MYLDEWLILTEDQVLLSIITHKYFKKTKDWQSPQNQTELVKTSRLCHLSPRYLGHDRTKTTRSQEPCEVPLPSTKNFPPSLNTDSYTRSLLYKFISSSSYHFRTLYNVLPHIQSNYPFLSYCKGCCLYIY